MLKRLKLALKVRSFTLLLLFAKGFIFAAALFLAASYGGFWPASLFILATLLIYFRPPFNWRKFFYSFLVITIYSFLITQFLTATSLRVAAAIFFGVLFGALLGLKNFSFQNGKDIFYYLVEALYFLVAAVFFVTDKSSWTSLFLLSIASFFLLKGLFRESLDFLLPEFPGRRKSLVVFGFAFIISQFLAVISLLPLGIFSSAALVVLFIIVLEDLMAYHLRGSLSRQTILNSVSVVVVLTVFIFLSEQILKL